MTGVSVMIGFPHDGNVRTEFMMSVRAAEQAAGSPVADVLDWPGGPFLAVTRARIAAAFLASDCEWLWMCDTDMVFTADTLPALLAYAHPGSRPLLGALCHTLTADGRYMTTAYRAVRDDTGLSFTSMTAPDLPPDTLVRVDATGAACLLAHRSVFGKITAQEGAPGLWFAEQVIGGRPFSEDLSFCLRAAAAGIPVYVHTGIQVGHMKTMQVGAVAP